LPEETYGIRGLAEFDIVTHKMTMIQTGVDGMPVSKFLKEFGAFTVVLEYDGIKVERRFSIEKIKKQIEAFEKSSNPEKTTMPRVTRKPTATPPPSPTFMTIPLPLPNPPHGPPNTEQSGK
jgi:hypothetical protein